ncbi:MaoC family dehydratase [Agromyces italicus]|uniref:MaoC family dehydratase n=1 Tax=Agromyces italicus TaxID=279572 RepID=UPI0003B3EA4C|nr:MaoC family dehydratase [Agromyces italicus]
MTGESIGLPEVHREVLQRGLWFEEFEPGTRYLHRPGRTVTEADNVLFTTLTMNTQSLHLDAAWAETQPFGERLMNSMFTLATIVGASVAQLTQGTIVANLGFTEVAFPAPLYHGDTLYSETVVVEVRESASRPGQGIVTLQHVGRNQDGVEVARARRSVLMWMREAGQRQTEAPTPRRGAVHRGRGDSAPSPHDGTDEEE